MKYVNPRGVLTKRRDKNGEPKISVSTVNMNPIKTKECSNKALYDTRLLERGCLNTATEQSVVVLNQSKAYKQSTGKR